MSTIYMDYTDLPVIFESRTLPFLGYAERLIMNSLGVQIRFNVAKQNYLLRVSAPFFSDFAQSNFSGRNFIQKVEEETLMEILLHEILLDIARLNASSLK